MDAIRLGALVSLGLFAMACAQTKTADSVFSTNSQSLCAQQASQKRFIVQWEDGRYTVESDSSPEEFKSGFVKHNLRKIKHVDYDYNIQLSPQDMLTQGDQVGAQTLESLNWQVSNIQADQLYTQNIFGDGVTIAVIDGMVDVTNNQLKPNILINTGEIPSNQIDDDNNGFIDDYMGIQVNHEINDPTVNRHGSHVAGIIAADPSKGVVQGIAPRAKILPAQFIGNGENGSIGDAIIAMNYAGTRGAKIINMSWGIQTCSQISTLQSALQKLSSAGILLVTAAGNGDDRGVGFNTDINPMIPGAYNLLNQINVAASTASDFLTGFSNYGIRTVHVAAPGFNVQSTIPGNSVVSMSGTSMAAPAVSGAAALLWSAIPSATATQIKQAIMKTVDIRTGANMEVASHGRINVSRALVELKRITGQ